MTAQFTAQELQKRSCKPCEGGVAPINPTDAAQQLEHLPNWKISSDGKAIARKWNCKNFVKSLAFCNRIGEIAENDQHHPDLHLTGYRHVEVVLTTHAIGGLSENDFIVAAKIDQLAASLELKG